MKFFAFRHARLALGTVLACTALSPALAQPLPDWKRGPYKPADWTALAQLPDLSGVWEVAAAPRPAAAARPAAAPAATRPAAPRPPAAGAGQPQLTPAYAAQAAAYHAAEAKGDIQDNETANCVPPGMPGIMQQPYPIEFLLTPGKVTIISEAYTQVRHIYTDGRPHPDDPDLTFFGHSTGKWAKGVLVVDSVGFSTDTFMTHGIRHSAKMHMVERMRLLNPDFLEIQTTVDDPEALTAPWVVSRTYARHRDWTTSEYICEQNNRNLVVNGKAGIILNK